MKFVIVNLKRSTKDVFIFENEIRILTITQKCLYKLFKQYF